MNKSEIAEKAAQNIYGLWADQGRLGVRKFGLIAIQAEVERAIAESRGQPESGCADNDPERDCKCGGERGKPSCAFPADRPTPTCQNCGWYLFSDTCDRCGASRPEIPCICREGLNNQLCQRHGAIAESQAPTVTLSQGGCSGTMPVYGAELGDGEPSPQTHSPQTHIHELDDSNLTHCVICGKDLRSVAAQEVSPPSPPWIEYDSAGYPHERKHAHPVSGLSRTTISPISSQIAIESQIQRDEFAGKEGMPELDSPNAAATSEARNLLSRNSHGPDEDSLLAETRRWAEGAENSARQLAYELKSAEGYTRELKAALRKALLIHWLSQIECNHEEKNDSAICACGWKSERGFNVGKAVELWIDHVFAELG